MLVICTQTKTQRLLVVMAVLEHIRPALPPCLWRMMQRLVVVDPPMAIVCLQEVPIASACHQEGALDAGVRRLLAAARPRLSTSRRCHCRGKEGAAPVPAPLRHMQ